jgi:hypothetical protein
MPIFRFPLSVDSPDAIFVRSRRRGSAGQATQPQYAAAPWPDIAPPHRDPRLAAHLQTRETFNYSRGTKRERKTALRLACRASGLRSPLENPRPRLPIQNASSKSRQNRRSNQPPLGSTPNPKARNPSLNSNAGCNFPQPMRFCFDDVEHLAAEGPDEFTGISWANAPDHPGAEIFFDSLCRGGRHRF